MDEDAKTQQWHEWFYAARGIRTPCGRCGGSGIRTYPNTATWRSRPGIVSGHAMTDGVCDRCWGSGDDKRHGLDLRKIMGELDECQSALKEIAKLPTRTPSKTHAQQLAMTAADIARAALKGRGGA